MATDNIQKEIDNINNQSSLDVNKLLPLFKALQSGFGIQPAQEDDILSGIFPPEVLAILEGITVQVPVYNDGSNGSVKQIKIVITCENSTSPWAIIPEVFVVEQISVSIEVIETAISATLYGTLYIEGIPLVVEADFPSMFVKAEMLTDDHKDSANKLLKRFQAGPISSGQLEGLTLTQLFLLGDPRNKKAVIRLGLGGIKIGPGTLALQGSLDYTGKPGSQVTGAFWGEYVIDPSPAFQPYSLQPYSFSLMAAFDGPGQGWKFEGRAGVDPTNQQKERAAGIADLIKVFDENLDLNSLPRFLKELQVVNLDLAFETETKNLSFDCEVQADQLFGANSEVEMIVSIHLKRNNPGEEPATYEKTFSGRLIIGLDNGLKMEFDVLFDRNQTASGSDTTFIASYKNLAGGDIHIGALTSKLDSALNIPLTINLKDAFLVYDKKDASTAPAANLLFGLDIGSGINLSNLPLVGKLFPDSQTLKIGFQPLIASGPGKPIFTKEELARLQALVPGGGITLPDTDISTTVDLSIHLQVGDTVKRLDLPIRLNPPSSAPQNSQDPTGEKPIGDALLPSTPAAPPAGQTTPANQGDITWLDIQKSFGPVQFNRAGFAFSTEKKEIHAYLDATLGLAGLTLSLDGLGVSSPITKFDPRFSLQGVGIAFEQGPIEIGGSFLRYTVPKNAETPAYDEYDGMATLKIDFLNISAIGSYARVNGHNSLFIYAVLNYPIGGPSFFFVTGLAAGFGYNRALRIPDITGVATFPLVDEAVNGAGAGPPADNAKRRDYLSAEITKLRGDIYPKSGAYFLAAGIHFSTFEVVDSFVMVGAEFGQHFEADVLGLSTMVLPTPEPGASQAVSPLAEVQMALKSVFNPEEGLFSVEAQLTNNSFLLSRSCHLTGGFAFYLWFGGAHKGDFVITLGGYHPAFAKPAWYPIVPRLGFNWILTSEIVIKGEAYFALTAHALMAGGKLELLFHAGPIKAWFIAGVDFLISWKPYFYMAKLNVDVGVSFTFWLFGTHTITASIGAELNIWGPDFSGIARVYLWIVSFTIGFGDASPKPRPIDWKTFSSSFLPDPAKVCSISVADGLIRQDPGKRAVVNPKELALQVNTVIPVKTFDLFNKEDSQLYFADSNHQIALGLQRTSPSGIPAPPPDFGIGPMDVSKVDSSKLTVTIVMDPEGAAANSEFEFLPIRKRMPRAMWGNSVTVETNGAQFIEDALVGFEIRPATPAIPSETHAVLKEELKYNVKLEDKAFAWAPIQSFSSSSTAKSISGSIYQQSGNRNEMLKSLGFNLDALHVEIPEDIDALFVTPPRLGNLA
ncbi:MAG: hypothetical protein H6563_14005 [Lewinellaceae bacterium]|nr:hypothetical protein [Lewinellaceae bacterium]